MLQCGYEIVGKNEIWQSRGRNGVVRSNLGDFVAIGHPVEASWVEAELVRSQYPFAPEAMRIAVAAFIVLITFIEEG